MDAFDFIWLLFLLGIGAGWWGWSGRKRKKSQDDGNQITITQRTRTKWGLVLLVLAFSGILLAVIIPNVGRFIGSGETEAAKTELSNIQAAAETELRTIQSAVVGMMVDNGLSTIPIPVTVATNDMSAFPDATSVAGSAYKQYDTNGNTYRRGDKSGYVLYQHDIFGDGSSATTVNYVATQYTLGTYVVGRNGTVTQVTTGYE